jgi:hypothetical protein
MKVRCQSISICADKSSACERVCKEARSDFAQKIRETEINGDKSAGYQRGHAAICICLCGNWKPAFQKDYAQSKC